MARFISLNTGIKTGLTLPRSLRALNHYNFRLFFFGQLISLIGTWMQSTAQQWLVYRLTDSQTSLGIVTFIGFLPVLLFSLFMGVVVDRLPKRRLLLFTQTWFMLLAGVLAFLTFTGWVQYWHILVLAFLLGIGNALDMPARQSFFYELVGREDLVNAVGLNSSIFNMARIIGPTVAGLVVAAVGEAPAFAINSVTFLAVLAGLALMRMKPAPHQKSRATGMQDLKEGLSFLFSQKQLFSLVAMIALFSLVCFPYITLLPVFARDVLGIGVQGFGSLMAAQGVGALAGALGVVFFGDRAHPGRMLLIARGLLAVAMLGLGLSRDPLISMGMLVLAGFSFVTQNSLTNTLLQISAPDALRGRVISAFTWAMGGFFPLGSVIFGAVGDALGAPNTVLIMAGGCLALVVFNLVVFPDTKDI